LGKADFTTFKAMKDTNFLGSQGAVGGYPGKIYFEVAKAWVLNENRVIDSMVAARERNKLMFFARFDANRESMKTYLFNGPVNNPNRILFLVFDFEKNLIAHAGFKSTNSNFIELDNVMKIDENDTISMYSIITILLNWVKNYYPEKTIVLKVLSTNHRALRLYQKLGFEEYGNSPLRLSGGTNGNASLNVCIEHDSNTYERMILMKIE
jgi:hypothetical protein